MDTDESSGRNHTDIDEQGRQVEGDVVDVAARLRLAVARLSRQLRQQAGTGLSPSQQSVLTSIEANDSLTLGELAAIEQVAPPSITKIVAKLEQDGLVARSVDALDRRVARVTVTAEGHRRLDHSRSRRNAWLAMRLRELTGEQLDQLGAAVDVLESMTCGPTPAPTEPGLPRGVTQVAPSTLGTPPTSGTGSPSNEPSTTASNVPPAGDMAEARSMLP